MLDFHDFMQKWQQNNDSHPQPRIVWDAAIKYADEKYKPATNAMDAMRCIVAARNDNRADVLTFFAQLADIVDTYAATQEEPIPPFDREEGRRILKDTGICPVCGNEAEKKGGKG